MIKNSSKDSDFSGSLFTSKVKISIYSLLEANFFIYILKKILIQLEKNYFIIFN